MWYVSDSPDLLGALQSAELTMLVTDLEAFLGCYTWCKITKPCNTTE
jgi:predicted metal-binding transcription factor (methanogenesis marker protein 9)